MSDESTKIIVFDTETTGLPDHQLDEYDFDQPWIVQLGVVELIDWEIAGKMNVLVCPPEGAPFNESAVNLHGITPELCVADGLPTPVVLESFRQMCQGADLICTYNWRFDERMIRTAAQRLNVPLPLWPDTTIEHCVMIQAQDFFGERIKLNTCYKRLFNRKLENAHDAFADTLAAMECFRHLTHSDVNHTPN